MVAYIRTTTDTTHTFCAWFVKISQSMTKELNGLNTTVQQVNDKEGEIKELTLKFHQLDHHLKRQYLTWFHARNTTATGQNIVK